MEVEELLTEKVTATNQAANLPDAQSNPLEEFLETEEIALLEQSYRAIVESAKLSKAEQEVHLLRRQQLSETGIASRLGKPVGTVRALDWKGKQKLKVAYAVHKAKQEAAA